MFLGKPDTCQDIILDKGDDFNETKSQRRELTKRKWISLASFLTSIWKTARTKKKKLKKYKRLLCENKKVTLTTVCRFNATFFSFFFYRQQQSHVITQ